MPMIKILFFKIFFTTSSAFFGCSNLISSKMSQRVVFQPSPAFHIENSRLISSTNQMTGFYIKCNSELKQVNIKQKFNPLTINISIIEKPVNRFAWSGPPELGGRGGGGGGWGGSPPPPPPPQKKKFSVNVSFFSMSSLNVLFLKEVTKNVYENHYMSKLK